MDIIANWLYREFAEAGVCCELRVAHEKSGKILDSPTNHWWATPCSTC